MKNSILDYAKGHAYLTAESSEIRGINESLPSSCISEQITALCQLPNSHSELGFICFKQQNIAHLMSSDICPLLVNRSQFEIRKLLTYNFTFAST